jgi:hypothetical protein
MPIKAWKLYGYRKSVTDETELLHVDMPRIRIVEFALRAAVISSSQPCLRAGLKGTEKDADKAWKVHI